ncbi:MAG: GNAT family N-acetyltransferase [Betaproteobacteria bacterium]|nr:MAG: GNAT family N-acetyltransferase [Betaproteobacteria bacterium]
MTVAAIRLAIDADVKRIATLATQVYLDTYATGGVWNTIADEIAEYFSLAAMQRTLDHPDRRILIAERGDRLLGFIQFCSGSAQPLVGGRSPAEIERLYVQRAQANTGIGSQLLSRAESMLGADGCDRVWLTAWAENARAIDFYSRRGYLDVGQSFYEFQGERYENRVFAKPL